MVMVEFIKIAPYLTSAITLIGFGLFLYFRFIETRKEKNLLDELRDTGPVRHDNIETIIESLNFESEELRLKALMELLKVDKASAKIVQDKISEVDANSLINDRNNSRSYSLFSGLMGLVALIFSVILFNGNIISVCKNGQTIDQKASAGWNHLSEGAYSNAIRTANLMIECDPDSLDAINLKGAVSFYKGRYKEAQFYFKEAHEKQPQRGSFARNYADSLMESSDKSDLNKALIIHISYNDDKNYYHYKTSIIQLKLDNLQESYELIKEVPSSFSEREQTIGSARIVESVILHKLGKVSAAKSIFCDGFKLSKSFWYDTIVEGKFYRHENFNFAKKELASVASEWTSTC